MTASFTGPEHGAGLVEGSSARRLISAPWGLSPSRRLLPEAAEIPRGSKRGSCKTLSCLGSELPQCHSCCILLQVTGGHTATLDSLEWRNGLYLLNRAVAKSCYKEACSSQGRICDHFLHCSSRT